MNAGQDDMHEGPKWAAYRNYDADAVEGNVVKKLKDFQKATVDHVFDLFTKEPQQKRVLVADEVGLGKTIIARGVIARLAKWRHGKNDDLFKVVYVCSNQSIANQNISRLTVGGANMDKDVAGTRLSMQHLKIAELDGQEDKRYIQLIPLTPGTSFNVKSGCGTMAERALIFTILKRMNLGADGGRISKEECDRLKSKLMNLNKNMREKRFGQFVDDFETAINTKDLNAVKGRGRKKKPRCVPKDYPESFIKVLDETTGGKGEEQYTVRGIVKKMLSSDDDRSPTYYIQRLRFLFACASVKMMKPDLIIMDEFQRFSSLIDPDNADSEAGILADEFLSGKCDGKDGLENHITRVLLLSATPYKSFSTRDEIAHDPKQEDVSEKEFKKLVDFLFEGRALEVKKRWFRYSKRLRDYSAGETTIVQARKDAEQALFGGMCRTERLSVMDPKGTISDEGAKKAMSICDEDVRSYVEFQQFLEKVKDKVSKDKIKKRRLHLPVEYIKSCPYLLSYLGGYTMRENIVTSIKECKGAVSARKYPTLCVNKNAIGSYEPLAVTNSRLRLLLEHAFGGWNGVPAAAAKYIWIPPTMPYYKMEGVYSEADKFSKVLVFSAWEMVPRMISTLVSYEAERALFGDRRKWKKAKYFTTANGKRNPQPRLKFELKYKTPTASALALFALLYPSKKLADMYNPLTVLEGGSCGRSLDEVKAELRSVLESELDALTGELEQKGLCSDTQGDDAIEDPSWYYLAPMLLDGAEEAFKWAKAMKEELASADKGGDEDESVRSKTGERWEGKAEKQCYVKLAERLKELQGRVGGEKINNPLGKRPADLVDELVMIALGSPAVCARRRLSAIKSDIDEKWESRETDIGLASTKMARSFFTRFNTPEAIAIIDPGGSGGARGDDAYWKDVLSYCVNGCLQAVLDEYVAVLSDEFVKSAPKQLESICEQMCVALQFRTTTYKLDTIDSIMDGAGKGNGKSDGGANMRSHYAAGFIKGTGEADDIAKRKDSVRQCFNSPFRPFVLASTSIGQEGLDFHPYCRKIFHWNLPTNPVDLEQREGRINRYKCLAVRECIVDDLLHALKDGDDISRSLDGDTVWERVYDFAQKRKEAQARASGNDAVCDLMPFWCYDKEQKVRIERIVPKYPFSRDEEAYAKLIEILSMYRISMGQPRQEELLEKIKEKIAENADVEYKDFFINLSPFIRKKGGLA